MVFTGLSLPLPTNSRTMAFMPVAALRHRPQGESELCQGFKRTTCPSDRCKEDGSPTVTGGQLGKRRTAKQCEVVLYRE